jgi:hypothetical protein
MVFFMHFTYRKNKSPVHKMTMPRGNFLEKIFELRLWFSFCAKKTLWSCTKTNFQQNQANGVWTADDRIWCFLTKFLKIYILTEQISGPRNFHFMRASCYHEVYIAVKKSLNHNNVIIIPLFFKYVAFILQWLARHDVNSRKNVL